MRILNEATNANKDEVTIFLLLSMGVIIINVRTKLGGLLQKQIAKYSCHKTRAHLIIEKGGSHIFVVTTLRCLLGAHRQLARE